MKTELGVAAAVASITLGSAALAQQQQQQQHTQHAEQQSAEQFLTQAVEGDLAEIALGELAEQKGQSEEVREYGQKLVEDHSRGLDAKKQLAEAQGIEVPEEPSPEAQQMHDQLSRLSGEEFDREFARHMVEDHEKAISMFETQAEGDDSETGELAEETLPVLEEHLQIAEAIESGNRG